MLFSYCTIEAAMKCRESKDFGFKQKINCVDLADSVMVKRWIVVICRGINVFVILLVQMRLMGCTERMN